jgi:hypothetical protein
MGSLMVKVKLALAAESAFEAVTVALKVPAAVGLPEKTPVVAFKETPGGNWVAFTL